MKAIPFFLLLPALRSAALLILLAVINPLHAVEIVDFENGTWVHPSGTSTGWDSSQLTGSQTLSDGNSVTMTVSFAGTATPAGGNLNSINETYFSGFAYQMQPDTNENNGFSFENYERIDFEFTTPVTINDLTITDVDRSGWDDMLYIEAWSDGTGVGTLGSGFTADYGFRSTTNLATETNFGLSHVTVVSNGNTQNAPESDLLVDFDQPFDAFSIYYWNGDYDNTDSTQTIGIEGNSFTIVPEPSSAILIVAAGLLGFTTRRRTQPA